MFSTGGLLSALTPNVPRFSNEGLVSLAVSSSGRDLRPVNIHLSGGSIPVMASQGVIGGLSRYATEQQFCGTGRKPSWYRS